MIRISQPQIKHEKTGVRLSSLIRLNEEEKEFFFEVPEEYEECLCTNVADAFLVGLLNFAQIRNEDICVEGKISERLLYQINTYYIPVTARSRTGYNLINVSAEVYRGKIDNRAAVATAASGGVDSYYSIVRHIKNVGQSYKLTHLIIANQYNHYDTEEENRRRFALLVEQSSPIADNYGLKLIPVYTNHNEFMFNGFVREYTLRICSYSFALQNLIANYYVSSGVPYNEFDLDSHDSDASDAFNLAMMSTNNLAFYSSGGELTRTEKIDFISKDPYIQKHLKVCNYNDEKNCSMCEKCMRTMTALDIVGRLDKFDESFDLDKFVRNKNKFFAMLQTKATEASPELLSNMKKYNYKIPFWTVAYGCTVLKLLYSLKHLLGKSSLIRKMYYRLKIDYIVMGKEKAIINRYGTGNQVDNE